MKDTGIVRRIDELGRVVIPKEIRSKLRIREADALELWVDKDCICFKKYDEKTPLKNKLQEIVNMLQNADASHNISVEDKAVVTSIVNMLLAKWKEGEQE